MHPNPTRIQDLIHVQTLTSTLILIKPNPEPNCNVHCSSYGPALLPCPYGSSYGPALLPCPCTAHWASHRAVLHHGVLCWASQCAILGITSSASNPEHHSGHLIVLRCPSCHVHHSGHLIVLRCPSYCAGITSCCDVHHIVLGITSCCDVHHIVLGITTH